MLKKAIVGIGIFALLILIYFGFVSYGIRQRYENDMNREATRAVPFIKDLTPVLARGEISLIKPLIVGERWNCAATATGIENIISEIKKLGPIHSTDEPQPSPMGSIISEGDNAVVSMRSWKVTLHFEFGDKTVMLRLAEKSKDFKICDIGIE